LGKALLEIGIGSIYARIDHHTVWDVPGKWDEASMRVGSYSNLVLSHSEWVIEGIN
jgi:hypothetical protein